MQKLFSLLVVFIQIALTFTTLFVIYMLLAILDYQGGFDSFFGLIIVQPIIAIIVSVLTVIICFVIGLPIRLNSSVKSWWTRHFYLSILSVLIGILLIILSLLPYFSETVSIVEDEVEQIKQVPNVLLFGCGWFITAFSLLHTFPPSLYRMIQNKKG